jgi:hypothetical protein
MRPPALDTLTGPWLAWLIYWLLTVSTAVRLVGELGAAVSGAGGLGQLAAAIVFVANMWTRVRMPGGVSPPQPLR